jgi:RNA polymerase sigma-70 factor (ECF subfamily)
MEYRHICGLPRRVCPHERARGGGEEDDPARSLATGESLKRPENSHGISCKDRARGGIYDVMPLERARDVASETLLIQQASGGSNDALAALFELHGALVHRVAYRLTLSADEAEDIVQEVFVGLPEALAAYGGRGAFEAWLRKVAVRVALTRLRSARRRNATAIEAQRDPARFQPDRLHDRLALEAAVKALPSDLRVVFMLRDVEGYSHAEIGSLLGILPGTSQVRLHRARRKLRALLEDA